MLMNLPSSARISPCRRCVLKVVGREAKDVNRTKVRKGPINDLHNLSEILHVKEINGSQKLCTPTNFRKKHRADERRDFPTPSLCPLLLPFAKFPPTHAPTQKHELLYLTTTTTLLLASTLPRLTPAMKMQGTTISAQTVDQASGQQHLPVEPFPPRSADNSSTLEHHAPSGEAVERTMTPLRHQPKSTSTGPASNNAHLVPTQIVTLTNPEPAPKAHGSKTITEEFVEMKRNLHGVIQSMERLGIGLVEANQLSVQEASVESIKQSINELLHTNKDRPVRARGLKAAGRKFPRLYAYRKTWSNKVN